MPNKLDIPADLTALIEKREQEDRRAGEGRPRESVAQASTGSASPAKQVERREGGDRRTGEQEGE